MLVDAERYPALFRLINLQLASSPNQTKFLTRRFRDETDLEFLEELSNDIGRLGIGLEERLATDYAWLCDEQTEEELYFRRHHTYRLTSFEQANAEVYGNAEYMTRYMNGLLFTQLWWSNHTSILRYYRKRYLEELPDGHSHLEIGPGHGLLLYYAAVAGRASSITGWDISPASIQLTTAALKNLGLRNIPSLQLQDLFSGARGEFDSIVFSEVLEHMEHPKEALSIVRSLLSDRGQLFLNMPINSPAPDHLFNVETPEALKQFVEGVGFKVVDSAFFPATNQTLEAARRKQLTISCAFIAHRI
jgi:2-polyprenyl-3-methyl-5-hydroxy-6-metoxy-1,4-benzoquinol methylase